MRVRKGKWGLAFGVEWFMLTSASELRQERKNHSNSAFVVVQMNRQQWLGIHEPVKGETYAAALLAALVVPNAIILYPITEDQVWVCAVQDGLPVIGHDRILPLDEGRNTAIEWSSMFQSVELVGDVAGAHLSFDDVLAQIEEGLKKKTLKRKQLASALLHRKGAATKRLVTLILFAALGVAGFAGFQQYRLYKAKAAQEQLSLAEAARAAMAELQNKAKVDADRRAVQARYDTQVADARKEYATRIDPTQFWAAVTHVRRQLPISSYGYRPQDTLCTLEQCRVTWTATSANSVNPADKLKLPFVESNYNTDPSATSVFVLEALAQMPMPKVPDAITNADQLRFWIHSVFVPRYQGLVFDQPAPVTVPPPQGTQVPPAVVAYVGKWHVSGLSVLKAGPLLMEMSRWPVRVTSVKIASGNFDLEGDYIFAGG